ncbi:hypothetical protein GCM10027612_13350 [Microbispora bryophytorum subsp. camponoti]
MPALMSATISHDTSWLIGVVPALNRLRTRPAAALNRLRARPAAALNRLCARPAAALA